jgi:hypothetical protein
MEKRKPMVRAMILNYYYRFIYVHSLKDMLENETFKSWWEKMDNFNRSYVLIGKRRKK